MSAYTYERYEISKMTVEIQRNLKYTKNKVTNINSLCTYMEFVNVFETSDIQNFVVNKIFDYYQFIYISELFPAYIISIFLYHRILSNTYKLYFYK